MKVAIIGSRNLTVTDLETYLPEGTTEIVSGGAKGVDSCAKAVALSRGLKVVEFLPDYNRYGKAAPLRRNEEIAEYADVVLAFWDGTSRGTKFMIDYCKKNNKQVIIHML